MTSETPQSQEELPLFYGSIRALDIEKDAELAISPPNNFYFASKTNAIPLLADEFSLAADFYPIVFSIGPSPVPAAVVGINQDENLFIDRDGNWLGGSYLPAYVRRYPFLLMDDLENKQYVLCIDDQNEMLSTGGEYKLFENGEPSSFTHEAMEFCMDLRFKGEDTDNFCAALRDYNLLTPYEKTISFRDGKKIQAQGFQIVDQEKFDQLSDSLIVEWRDKGWLVFINAHIDSINRWQHLANLLRNRIGMEENLINDTEEFRLVRRPSKGGIL